MRKFLSIKVYAVRNWPRELKDEFSVLLDKCTYDLRQSSLNTLLCLHQLIVPLPPVHERAFEPHVKSSAHKAVEDVADQHCTYDILTLYEKCGAIKVGQFILGSKSSRFYKGSVVKVQAGGNDKLAEIQYFARCAVSYHTKTSYIWLAAVCFYPEHQCKVWYGRPTEVWGGVADVDIHFLPVTVIQNRVAFAKCQVNFGRVIGTDSAIVITPLN